jgi:hypothetical protein
LDLPGTGLKVFNFDGFAKKKNLKFLVISAQAGIQEFYVAKKHWIPAFAGMTTFCDCINLGLGTLNRLLTRIKRAFPQTGGKALREQFWKFSFHHLC